MICWFYKLILFICIHFNETKFFGFLKFVLILFILFNDASICGFLKFFKFNLYFLMMLVFVNF